MTIRTEKTYIWLVANNTSEETVTVQRADFFRTSPRQRGRFRHRLLCCIVRNTKHCMSLHNTDYVRRERSDRGAKGSKEHLLILVQFISSKDVQGCSSSQPCTGDYKVWRDNSTLRPRNLAPKIDAIALFNQDIALGIFGCFLYIYFYLVGPGRSE